MTNIQNTPPAQGAPFSPSGSQIPVQKSNSGTAIAGLVLGIIAIIISWIPIINNFAFFLGFIGLVLAVIGVLATVKKKKSGKGIAIAALVLNILSLIFVLITQSFYGAVVDSIDETLEGSSTTVSSQTDQEDNTTEEETNTHDLTVGTTIEVNGGLSVTVDSIETDLVNYDGSSIVGVQVTYVNNSSESQSYNSWDWKGETSTGSQEYTTYYSEGEEMSSGTLAAGGSKTGFLYFEGDTVKILYFSSFLSDDPAASWLVE